MGALRFTTGTGGDFRRSLGLPNSALDAVQYVGENPRRVDIESYTRRQRVAKAGFRVYRVLVCPDTL